MTAIWRSLVDDPKAALEAAFPALMAELSKAGAGRLETELLCLSILLGARQAVEHGTVIHIQLFLQLALLPSLIVLCCNLLQ